MNIALCDDDKNMLLQLARSIEELFGKHDVRVETETFNSPDDFSQRIKQKHFDIAFLDIDMPGTDGIALGKKLKKDRESMEIVYVSSREDRVFETFAVRPFGFVRKGNFRKDSEFVVNRLVSSLSEQEDEAFVDIKTNNSIMSIKISELLYIESQKDYQYFYMLNKTEPLRLRSGMDNLEAELDKYNLLRIHKGYLVNYLYIKRIDDSGVTLTNGQILPVSRRKLSEVRARYLELGSSSGRGRVE